MRVHLSPSGEYLECRAKHQCPFGGSHDGLSSVVEAALERDRAGSSQPVLRLASGRVRAVEVVDGVVKIGHRTYMASGEQVLAGSSLRSRATRARRVVEKVREISLGEKKDYVVSRMDELLTKHGLKQEGFKFRWNKRTQALGTTKWLGGKPHSIEFSSKWVEVLPIEEIEDTITHEISHALVGHKHGHDEVWQAQHRALGGNGQACHSGESQLHKAWVGKCPVCDKQSSQHRAPTSLSSCGRCCGGSFKPEFIFDWYKNGEKVAHANVGKAYARNYEYVKMKHGL